MPIQDLAGNLFTSTTMPMIGFVDVQLAKPRELSLSMYRFLIEGIREADQVDGDRFIERFLQGPQGIWASTDASIRSLPDMWSVTKCADRFLPFLKWIVGWTSELDYITDELDAVTLRRLIATSVPFWKIRGVEDALTDVLQLTTAARTRVLDWFDLRYIADETSVGEVHLGFDSWMLELPGTSDYPEMQMNVRIVDDGTLNRRLVRNLVKLTRPASERITITYLGFLDLFTVDDDASQWTNPNGDTSPPVHDGSMFLNLATDSLYANPNGSNGWRNYVVSVTFKGPVMVFSVYRTSDNDNYLILYEAGQVVVYSVIAGTPNPIAVAVSYAPDYPPTFPSSFSPDMWFVANPADLNDSSLIHTLRVQVVQEGAANRITVWLNGNLMLSALDPGGTTHTQGTFGFVGGFVSGALEVREVEMFFLPLQQDFIDIQGASDSIEQPA